MSNRKLMGRANHSFIAQYNNPTEYDSRVTSALSQTTSENRVSHTISLFLLIICRRTIACADLRRQFTRYPTSEDDFREFDLIPRLHAVHAMQRSAVRCENILQLVWDANLSRFFNSISKRSNHKFRASISPRGKKLDFDNRVLTRLIFSHTSLI